MPNRLATESSPYLLQHANNPVDWYPWSEEALTLSRESNKPIFLSIGYSACHWCHVMEHESFEDEQIAQQLNSNFVCIKVDREERPDLDQIYMQAVQMMTGRGGWPMSVFLTPDLQPFFGGTYWPPQRRHGMPGFGEVLAAVLDAWENRREMAIEQAAQLTERINSETASEEGTAIDYVLLDKASREICSQFDSVNGGFGEAPKFPHSMIVQFLLRMWHRDRDRNADLLEVATKTLDKMAAGGIYDHLAGGFARYSVDAQWLVPHFEKMLYDNALLADAYIDAYAATGRDQYAVVAREICDYILGYMTDSSQGFHSTEDADSEGEEGKFYVWTAEEIEGLLEPELAERFCYVFDITERGNFEGKNIPNLPKSLEQCAQIKGWDPATLKTEMVSAKETLLAVRDQRIRPGKDDKILSGWNGLMIHSMARIGSVLNEPRFVSSAVDAADFILNSMRSDDGRLLHTYRHGEAKLAAYVDDYANLTNAFVTLYESTFQDRWIEIAIEFADVMLARFRDPTAGGFYYTANDHESLIARPKDLQDNSVPSGNAMAATALQRLGTLCNREDYLQAAEEAMRLALPIIKRYPLAVGQMLIAADNFVGPMQQIVVAEPTSNEARFADAVRRRFLPTSVLAAPSDSPHLASLVAGKATNDGKSRLYLCEQYACQKPIEEDEIDTRIESLD